MKPVYFPYTYLNETTAGALNTCFDSVRLYQPSRLTPPVHNQRWVESGFVDLRVPFESGAEILRRKLTEYRNWVDSHRGGQIDFLKLQSDRVPFFGESSVAQIKADIRENHPANEWDPVFRARLFLQIAQEFDMQTEELNLKIALLAAAEQDIFKHIRGDEGREQRPLQAAGPPEDEHRSEYMWRERLTAWCHLYLKGPLANESAETEMFITTSRPLMTFLLEESSTREVLHFEALPQEIEDFQVREAWRRNINTQLEMLFNGIGEGSAGLDIFPPPTQGSSGRFSFSVYQAPGVTFRDYFSRVGGLESDISQRKDGQTESSNTLIGWLQIL